MSEKKYHAVSVGKKTGIFLTWSLCNKQVNKYAGATHEGFEELEEAVTWLLSHGSQRDTITVYDKKGDTWNLEEFTKSAEECTPLYVNLPPVDPTLDTTINNALLSYIIFSMQSGTAEKIRSVVQATFTIDDIIISKDMLWAAADLSVIGDRKRRRDGPNKSEKDSHTNDIITALYQLDAAGETPHIVLSAKDLGCIPRSHPEELNDISMADRLNRMEDRLTSLTQVVDHTVATNLILKDQINTLQHTSRESYAGVVASNTRCEQPSLIPSLVALAPVNSL